ncbi:MAG: fructuronate reductase [Alphaproteobacteria bacterium]|jgi:fructuronate reductase
MDGSQKIVQRILGPIADNIAANAVTVDNRNSSATRSYKVMIAVVASWMLYLRGQDEAGNTFELRDPFATELHAMALKYQGSPEDYVEAVINTIDIIPASLSQNSEFVGPLVEAITAIEGNGLAKYLQSILHL